MIEELEKINTNPKTLEDAVQVIGQLIKIIIEQKKEIDSLRERVNANSKNSSLPPYRDLKKRKKLRLRAEGSKEDSQVIKLTNE